MGAKDPPRRWKRYVDDTHTVLKKAQAQEFTDYLNTVDEDIKWTTEGETLSNMMPTGNESEQGSRSERTLAFLDTVTVVRADGEIRTRVFRKETHTDQYLNFKSNHPLEHKRGVVNTLMHRADIVVSDDQERKEEKQHITSVLGVNGYPDWVVKQYHERAAKRQTRVSTNTNKAGKKPAIVIPYVKGVSEKLRAAFSRFNTPVYFKPTNTLRQQLVHPKDKLGKEKTVSPVYHIPCEDCDEDYIGESERSLKARFDEHKRPSTTTSEVSKHIHSSQTPHRIDLDSTKVLTTESKWFERGVKEAIFIRGMSPTLNRDGGRYQLPPIWTNLIKTNIKKRERGTPGGGARSSSK